VIAPGRAYEYTSGAPLETASGFMTGTYHMRASTGESFEVGIPMFALESPYEAHGMH
jgi:ApaG protein